MNCASLMANRLESGVFPATWYFRSRRLVYMICSWDFDLFVQLINFRPHILPHLRRLWYWSLGAQSKYVREFFLSNAEVLLKDCWEIQWLCFPQDASLAWPQEPPRVGCFYVSKPAGLRHFELGSKRHTLQHRVVLHLKKMKAKDNPDPASLEV